MKKLVLILGMVAALSVFLWNRGPSLPEMRDALGLFPPIPAEKRSVRQLKAALQDEDAAVRREALRSLGRMMDHERLKPAVVVPILLEATKDGDGHVRAVATAYLANYHVDPHVSVPVFIALLKDRVPLVRMNAARGLSLQRPDAPALIATAVPALLEAWHDTDMDTRRYASEVLLHFPEHRYTVPEAWRSLDREAAVKWARDHGWSVEAESLQRAVQWNDVAGVFLLLKAGVDPNTRTAAGRTALFQVDYATRPEIVQLLLDGGIDVTPTTQHGLHQWPMMMQSRRMNPNWRPFGDEVVDMLRAAYVKAGIDVDTLPDLNSWSVPRPTAR